MNGDEPNVGPAEPGLPFYLEAKVGRTDANMRFEADARFWFENQSTLRIESDTPRTLWTAPGHEVGWGTPGTSVTVFDGERSWSGATVPGLYYRSRPLGDPDRLRPWGLDSTRLGPLYDQDFQAFLATPRPDTRVERLGTDEILGIQAEKVRIVSTIVVSQPGSAAPEPGFDVTYWIDPQRMLLLRYESRPAGLDGLVIWAEVKKLEYGPRQAAEKFVWVPVPGAIEAKCNSDPEVLNGILPAPFVSFPTAFLPTGWSIRSGGVHIIQGQSECGSAQVEIGTAGNDGLVLLKLTESVEDPSAVVSAFGEAVDIGGVAARTWSSEGWLSVGWADAALGVQLSSPVLALEELVAIAAAMLADQ
jgi:outer membrane lipoprotein-sorting protein